MAQSVTSDAAPNTRRTGGTRGKEGGREHILHMDQDCAACAIGEQGRTCFSLADYRMKFPAVGCASKLLGRADPDEIFVAPCQQGPFCRDLLPATAALTGAVQVAAALCHMAEARGPASLPFQSYAGNSPSPCSRNARRIPGCLPGLRPRNLAPPSQTPTPAFQPGDDVRPPTLGLNLMMMMSETLRLA